jgi:hypothetical protein
MALCEFVWEINQKIAPTSRVILSLDESKDSATTKSENPATNSETLPAHLGSVLRSQDPRQMGITT